MAITGGFKRSVINMNILPEYQRDFIFIDLIRPSVAQLGGYANETDSQGWALTNSSVQAKAYFTMPDVAWVRGINANVYVITGLGAGTIQIGNAGGMAFTVRSTTNAISSGGLNIGFTVSGDQTNRWRIVVQRTDHLSIWGSLGNGVGFAVISTRTGNHITDCHYYRLTDEVDFIGTPPTTGTYNINNYFRSTFKQQVIDWNPAAIRFMDWTQPAIRWRNRVPPEYFYSAATANNYNNLLKYGYVYYQTSPSTDKTVFFVDAVTGTPTTYQHGEQCFAGFQSSFESPNGTTSGGDFISAIVRDSVNPAYTKVTTRSINASSFNVGDQVQFFYCNGMLEINWMVGTIQTIGIGGSHNFTVNIDCSAFGAYTGGGAFSLYLTMNVGNRGAMALRYENGTYPASFYGQVYLYAGKGGTYPFSAGSSRIMIFEKNAISKIDSDRTVHWGVWTIGAPPYAQGINQSNVQPEMALALINELEAMIIAQGLQNSRGPISPWVNIPVNGLLSTDPDYDPADNVATNLVGTFINGYPSLNISPMPSRCSLFLEYSNETWNVGGNNNWTSWLSTLRWGASIAGFNDDADSTALRAIQMVQDVKRAFPGFTQFKPIMACHGASGPAGEAHNYGRLYGTYSTLLSDSGGTATIPPGANPVYYGTTYNQQASFRGTGGGTNLTVTGVTGTIQINQVLNGTGVPSGTIILSQTSGTPGGAGIYVTNNATTSNGAALTSNTAPITFFWGYASAPYMDPNKYYEIIPNQGGANSAGTWWAPGTYNTGAVVLAGPNGGNFHNYTCKNNGVTSYPPSDATNWTDNGVGSWNSALTYAANDVVVGSDYHNYTTLVGSNTGNNPTTDGGVHWADNGLNPYANAIQTWVGNGQVHFSSFTSANPTYVTTTSDPTAKGFVNGSLVMLTNFIPSSSGNRNNLQQINSFGYISNVTSSGFNINIDSSDFNAISTGGNVTRLDGSDQEAAYASWLIWLANRNGFDGDLNRVKTERTTYPAALNPFGVFHVNYEGWEQIRVNSGSYYQIGAARPSTASDDNAFLIGCKRSQAMASYMKQYCSYTSAYGAYMPAIFTYEDAGWWGLVQPSSFGFATPASGYAEWSGLSPASSAMAAYNAGANKLTIKFIFSR